MGAANHRPDPLSVGFQIYFDQPRSPPKSQNSPPPSAPCRHQPAPSGPPRWGRPCGRIAATIYRRPMPMRADHRIAHDNIAPRSPLWAQPPLRNQPDLGAHFVAPLQGSRKGHAIPRALPWASLWSPFGASGFRLVAWKTRSRPRSKSSRRTCQSSNPTRLHRTAFASLDDARQHRVTFASLDDARQHRTAFALLDDARQHRVTLASLDDDESPM
jgi:hypothetical protein